MSRFNARAGQKKSPAAAGAAAGLSFSKAQSLVDGTPRQRCKKKQRDDVGDLDHRIDGRAGSVLVGIADGVAGHRSFVGLGAFAAVIAVFDVLLGVVPSAAA